jgi:hypothetical protein
LRIADGGSEFRDQHCQPSPTHRPPLDFFKDFRTIRRRSETETLFSENLIMLRRSSMLATLAIASACASTASAQHAGFVLFGEPTQRVQEIDPSNRFVHPITAPYSAEDSFITTDIRAFVMFQRFDNDFSNYSSSDDVKIYGIQARLALTNQTQLLIYKAGYNDFDGALDSGITDLGIGFKWNFIQDWGTNLHAAFGVGYDIPIGDSSFDDDDELRIWLSVDKGFGDLHLGGSVQYRYANNETPIRQVAGQGTPATNDDDFAPFPEEGDSSILSLHFHADYYLNKWVSPVVELNYYQPVSASDFNQTFWNGGDIANLATDQSNLTLGLGAELRPIEKLGLRAAYEFSLLSNEDILDWRVTVSAVYGF